MRLDDDEDKRLDDLHTRMGGAYIAHFAMCAMATRDDGEDAAATGGEVAQSCNSAARNRRPRNKAADLNGGGPRYQIIRADGAAQLADAKPRGDLFRTPDTDGARLFPLGGPVSPGWHGHYSLGPDPNPATYGTTSSVSRPASANEKAR